MTIRWHGTEPLVIGEADDDGNVISEFVIQPGDEIPPDAVKLMAGADTITTCPRKGDYSRDETEAQLKRGKP